jgi:two-component system sensor histidine kinase MprB
VARARRRFGREVLVRADESVVDGRPNALERAVQNLVDNACKFAPHGAIEVSVADGTVTVRDHGPGLHEADIPHLFDRFFRSVEMRSKPGSGLGLSIVKSVVEGHGGTVFALNSPDGGAEIGFTIPHP